MKGIDLYEAIGEISDQYIEEMDQKAKKVISFRGKTIASVAGFVAVLVLGVTSYEYTHRNSTGDAAMPETAMITREFSAGASADNTSTVAEADMVEENMVEGIAEDGVMKEATLEVVEKETTEELEVNTESLDILKNDIAIEGLKVEYKGTVYYEKHCCELKDSKDLSAYGEFTLVGNIGESNFSIIEGMVETGDLYIEEATGTLALVTENLIYLLIKES